MDGHHAGQGLEHRTYEERLKEGSLLCLVSLTLFKLHDQRKRDVTTLLRGAQQGDKRQQTQVETEEIMIRH